MNFVSTKVNGVWTTAWLYDRTTEQTIICNIYLNMSKPSVSPEIDNTYMQPKSLSNRMATSIILALTLDTVEHQPGVQQVQTPTPWILFLLASMWKTLSIAIKFIIFNIHEITAAALGQSCWSHFATPGPKLNTVWICDRLWMCSHLFPGTLKS